MPPETPHRQPEPPLRWYGSQAGEGLLEVEQAAMARVLAACARPVWAWLGVPGARPPEVQPGWTARRSVLLQRDGCGFAGALRCALPLPLASESFGAVLVQHALDDTGDPLAALEECERILAPGGVLWLAVLNPWSPYRTRWLRSGLHAHDPGYWQKRLRQAGFALDSVSVQWFGPRWRPGIGETGVGAVDRLRAGLALTVNKRVHAVIPPRAVRAVRWNPGTVAAAGGLRGTRRRGNGRDGRDDP